VGEYLVLSYISNASSLIKLADKSGRIIRKLDFPSAGSIYGPTNEFGSNKMFFGFSSFKTPNTIYSIEVPACRLKKIFQSEAGVRTNNILIKQVWYKSKDKTAISMYLVYKKSVRLEGNSPVLLTGYGASGFAFLPSFNYGMACFIQKGGIVAIPNIRGGGEYGNEWRIAGRRDKKQNSFDDFIAAAEWLISNNYTNNNKLAIMGMSNGGLLVGACMTQRPDLYKAVVCRVGVLDMLRYDKLDRATLPISEYGSAINPKDFNYLIKYSPYHNVKKDVAYPAVLFTAADMDDRVEPMHSWKMAALMQSINSPNPVLLRTEYNAGHFLGRSVYKIIEEFTDIWTFIYDQLGITS
jgi:prolyl oligopeptidase